MTHSNNEIISRQLEHVAEQLTRDGRLSASFMGGYIGQLAKILDEATEHEQTRMPRPWSVNEERSKLL